MYCYPKPACSVLNCDTCSENSTAECKKCRRGNFLFDGACIEECPVSYNADRITWSCLEPPVFAWYWVYPSTTSCKTNCGIVVQEDWDCSCSPDCFRFGNCCQDIEDFCPDLIYWRKKPAALRKDTKKVTKVEKNKKDITHNPKLSKAVSAAKDVKDVKGKLMVNKKVGVKVEESKVNKKVEEVVKKEQNVETNKNKELEKAFLKTDKPKSFY